MYQEKSSHRENGGTLEKGDSSCLIPFKESFKRVYIYPIKGLILKGPRSQGFYLVPLCSFRHSRRVPMATHYGENMRSCRGSLGINGPSRHYLDVPGSSDQCLKGVMTYLPIYL